MIVRLPTDLAADLDGVAKVNRIPVAEAVRQAISDQIEVRRGDAEFKARIQRLVDENQEILDRLAGLAGVAEPRYLDLADFLLIAEAVLRVPAAELTLSARLPLAESALAAPARTHAHRRLAYIDRHVLPVGEHAETVSLLDGQQNARLTSGRVHAATETGSPPGERAGGHQALPYGRGAPRVLMSKQRTMLTTSAASS